MIWQSHRGPCPGRGCSCSRHHAKPPERIVLDLDATDRPAAWPSARPLLPRLLRQILLPAALHLLRRSSARRTRLRPADIDASAGALRAEIQRIVSSHSRSTGRTCQDRGCGADSRLLPASDLMTLVRDPTRCDYRVRAGAQRTVGSCGSLAAELRPGEGSSVEQTQSARPGFSRTSPIARARAGRDDGGSSARPSICRRDRTPASSSPRSSRLRSAAKPSMKKSTALAAIWRTGSRKCSSICSPIAPRPPP